MAEINAKITHELWIEGRQFSLDLSRPSATTIALKVSYPATSTQYPEQGLSATDGAVVLLSTKPLVTGNHPTDGSQYASSLDLAAPSSLIPGAGGAQVVGFFSAVLGNALPGVLNTATGNMEFTITVGNAVAGTIYYASVHAASNVLQYYPYGVQSYPIVPATTTSHNASTYTGSIPQLDAPPTTPTVGFVYFDRANATVQFWTGTQWIPTRADSISTGTFNPGSLGQTYFYTGLSQIQIFDGSKWVVATSSNLQFQLPGPVWVPFSGTASSGVKLPATSTTVGDFFWDFTLQRGQYWSGTQWIYPNASNTLFNRPPLTPAFTTFLEAVGTPLIPPFLGQLFYNTSLKVLNVWTGTTWVQANTDQQGVTSSDKIGVGDDGSYEARLRLINILKNQLGYPTMCVELKEEQFNIAVDNALDTYRQMSDHAYTLRYILYTVIGNQQTYYLNSATDNTDKIVNVHKIHRLNVLGANSLNWDSNVYFQTFLNQYYSGGMTDTLSIHLVHSLSKDFERLFAGNFTFLWNEAARELFITRNITRNERIILEATCERTEQELLTDRYAKQWLQNWALSECKEMLGYIRSKFQSGTPGAAGTINLNGEQMLSDARQDQVDLREQLLNYEVGGLVGMGNSSFLVG